MRKMEKKVISITVLMVMLVAMLIPNMSSATTGEVVIKDSKLKEAITKEVDDNKDGIITEEEMKRLVYLEIPEGVTDLTGLEYATDLSSVVIIYTGTIANLKGEIKSKSDSLRVTIIISNSVKSEETVKFNFLKRINNITELFIKTKKDDQWKTIDYSDLKDLNSLKGLNLESQAVPDSISELGSISSLEWLSIGREYEYRGRISMNGVENLSNLTFLNISSCDIDDEDKIREIKNLRGLYISNMYGAALPFSDLSCLENKTTLVDLSLTGSGLKSMKDVSAIATLNLRNLTIDVGEHRIQSVEEFKKEYEEYLANETSEANNEQFKTENSKSDDLRKTPTETKTAPKTEAKKQAEKPTRIPQAGINVVGNAISILVAISVFLLVVAFVKAKRK